MHAGKHPATATPADPGHQFGKPSEGLRARLYTVIFEADTRAGRIFDLALIVAILASVMVVVLDSVQAVSSRHGDMLGALEWFFTLLFTVEYAARLYCVRRPLRYATSFFGAIDFLSVLPTYLAMMMPGAHVLLDVRILRLLRIFRILKLTSYVEEYRMLTRALLASRRKILIFLSVVMMVVLLLGTVMYVVEGPGNGFTSIPTSVYWAITAITTVGFGDIVPKTDIGRAISSIMMLLGWGILAVPTGIISSEMTMQNRLFRLTTTRTCPECLSEGHEADAKFCKDCGAPLPAYQRDR
ncbi:ion transporter [Noviherbaspirillum sp. 1P10PC]|uniref:ion transporter n=1 Tax=Noviherbaspirillum sp. 1P10PC TaxID=3132292 RepID=UPI0039A263F8